LPLYLYNVPGRTVADLANETVLRLAEIPNIVGLKDATGNIGRATELFRALRRKNREDFGLLSGDDITALAYMMLGGHGVISVTACVAPKEVSAMCRAVRDGDFATAISLNDRLLPLHRKLFVEGSPVPVKWAMAEMGLVSPGIRLPLAPLSEAQQPVVREALVEAGCLK
jgi:4-hydroxy-tetrahydrodipicolinate synthase